MPKILLLSNGHGEDLSGALIGKALQRIDHHVDAFPLVGDGNSYLAKGIRVLGKTKVFSTGGLGYTSFYARLTELCQGQLFYLLRRLNHLYSIAGSYDLIVVIGDVICVCAAWLTGLPVATYLVAYSSHYEGKLKMPWPCKHCLSSKRFLSIYTRDWLTADDLTAQLWRKAIFLGNPFLDQVLDNQPALPRIQNRLCLLPGTRRPELDENLLLILRLLENFPSVEITRKEISFDIPLVSVLSDAALRKLVVSRGWEFIDSNHNKLGSQLVRNQLIVNVHRDSFSQVLQSSDVVLSMSGTATEQAVGLGRPVVQLVGKGPQFTASFAEAQRRLLGPMVFCIEGIVGEKNTFIETAYLIIDLLNRVKSDLEFKKEIQRNALQRVGTGGGSELMAKAISDLI